MGSRTLFALRVIRCPACHARLPVQGGESMVRCEYCDAHVQLAGTEPKKKKKSRPATPHGPPPPVPPALSPTHVAQAHYSGCAWVVFIVPLMSIGGVILSMSMSMGLHMGDLELLWHDLTQGTQTRTQQSRPEAATKSDAAEATEDESDTDEQDTDDEDTDDEPESDEPGRVGRLFSTLAERAEEAEAADDRAAARRRARAATPKAPEGPVLTVSEAKAELVPMVLECLKAAKVHHVTAHMGNSKEGGVSILTSARVSKPRIDGKEVKLHTTALGRCMNDAGKKVRTRAFGGNYIIIDVRNPGVPDPLGHLPQTIPRDVLAEAVSALDAEVRACAKKHGEEGRETGIRLRIDGPTGKLVWARPVYTSKAFNACAEALYRKIAFPKARRHVIEYHHKLRL